jgi:hypothetical protein
MARIDKVVLSPQCADIVSALRGGSRTSLQLQRMCCIMAIGARIHELRSIGFNIDTQLVPLRGRRSSRRHPAHIALYTMRRRTRRTRKAA